MSFPEHTNPSKGRDAKAPYNFVPLAEKIVPELSRPDRDVYYSNRFTGVIHCMLKTESPLYTRAALEQDEYRKKPTKDGEKSKNKSDFFYVDPATKQPVIPGSSLRGMLRTLVEIITFSKPQPVTDRQLFFRTLDDTAIGKAYGKRMVGGDGQKKQSNIGRNDSANSERPCGDIVSRNREPACSGQYRGVIAASGNVASTVKSKRLGRHCHHCFTSARQQP